MFQCLASVHFASGRRLAGDLLHGRLAGYGVAYVKGEVHDFYKTSWFVEFEVLNQMVKVRGSCDKPFKRYSRLKNLLCERPQGTNS